MVPVQSHTLCMLVCVCHLGYNCTSLWFWYLTIVSPRDRKAEPKAASELPDRPELIKDPDAKRHPALTVDFTFKVEITSLNYSLEVAGLFIFLRGNCEHCREIVCTVTLCYHFTPGQVEWAFCVKLFQTPPRLFYFLDNLHYLFRNRHTVCWINQHHTPVVNQLLLITFTRLLKRIHLNSSIFTRHYNSILPPPFDPRPSERLWRR